MPGILVEAKIAGLTCVVSNKSYNSELVRDGEEGIVMPSNDAETLAEMVRQLDADRTMLSKLKEGSRQSAERFYIESYIDEIARELKL